MKHKKQHFISQFYLQAWCDPETPEGQDPYVWQFSEDGSTVQKKAPKNIFYETDMYTIKNDDGSRNLVLEHGLNQLETLFSKLRREILQPKSPLTDDDKFLICVFVSAMFSRTKAQREHTRKQWGEALETMEEIIKWAKTASSGWPSSRYGWPP